MCVCVFVCMFVFVCVCVVCTVAIERNSWNGQEKAQPLNVLFKYNCVCVNMFVPVCLCLCGGCVPFLIRVHQKSPHEKVFIPLYLLSGDLLMGACVHACAASVLCAA